MSVKGERRNGGLRNKNKERGEKKSPGGISYLYFSLSLFLSASRRNVRVIESKRWLRVCDCV